MDPHIPYKMVALNILLFIMIFKITDNVQNNIIKQLYN